MNPKLLNAEDLGVRFEIAGNLPIWKASPPYKYQTVCFRRNEKREMTSPVEIEFECSCGCTV